MGPVVHELVSVMILAGPTVPELWASDPSYYIGGLALATSLDQLLFGILLLEVWSYYHWFQNDRFKFKALVAILFGINLAQTCVTTTFGYLVFVKEIGKWDRIFGLVNIEWEVCLVFEAAAVALAQVYFLDRAYKISKKNIYLLVFCGLSIPAAFGMGLAASFATVAAAVKNDVNFDTFTVLTNLVIAWKSCTGATDLVLSGTIIFCLLRSRTGWSGTDQTIKNLIKFTFEAQCLPLIAGLFFLATYAYDGNSNLCLLGSFNETKLAAISVLHVLNSRGRLRHDWSSNERSSSRSGNVTTRAVRSAGGTKGVNVFTETLVHSSEPDEFDPHRSQHSRHRPQPSSLEDRISLESFEKSNHTPSHTHLYPPPQAHLSQPTRPHNSSLDDIAQFYSPPPASRASADGGPPLEPARYVDTFPYPDKS